MKKKEFDLKFLLGLRAKDPAAFYNDIFPRLTKREIEAINAADLEETVEQLTVLAVMDLPPEGFPPLLSGRPSREHIINSDDISNLVIAMNTIADFESFLEGI